MSDRDLGNHDNWDELAAGFALHSLSPDEEVVFADHLESCPRCVASVDEHTLVTAQLGALAHDDEAAEPPSWSSMRAAVLSPSPSEVVDLTARRRRRYDGSRRLLAAAAAVVVLAGGGIAAWRVTGSSTTPNHTATSALPACAATGACHIVTLTGAKGSESPAARVMVAGTTVSVTPGQLRTPSAGTAYVLWQMPRDGRPVALTEFSSTAARATPSTALQVAYSDTAAFAISSEPAGTLPDTPSDVVAIGSAS